MIIDLHHAACFVIGEIDQHDEALLSLYVDDACTYDLDCLSVLSSTITSVFNANEQPIVSCYDNDNYNIFE